MSKINTDGLDMRSARRLAKRCGTDEETVVKAMKRLSRGDSALYRQVIASKIHPKKK